MTKRTFKSIEELEKYYSPNYCKKYPITIRVTEEEEKRILLHRGSYTSRRGRSPERKIMAAKVSNHNLPLVDSLEELNDYHNG